jgi:hypothetical protein
VGDPQSEPQGVGGPFLTIATFCERILNERDGVNTLVRVVDRYYVEPLPAEVHLPPDVKPGFQTFLVIVVKSGDFRGQATVTIRRRNPSGEYPDKQMSVPLDFKGDEHGTSLNIGMTFPATEVGLHWVDVELDGRLLTRVPLRVEHRSKPESSPDSTPARDSA